MEPCTPLHLLVPQHTLRDTRVCLDEAPPLLIDVPFLFDVHDLANSTGTNNIANGKGKRLTTMLRAHLNDLSGGANRVPCMLGFLQHIGEWLLDIAILACTHNVDA